MPRRQGYGPDVFASFPDRVESEDEAHSVGLPSRGSVARSAALTVGAFALSGLGALGGGWLAAGHLPEAQYSSLFWEGVVLVLWCGLWGGLAGAVTLSAGLVAVGLPWVRRQRRARGGQRSGGATSTSRP